MRRVTCFRKLIVCLIFTLALSTVFNQESLKVQAFVATMAIENNITWEPAETPMPNPTSEPTISPMSTLTPEPIVSPTSTLTPEPTVSPTPTLTPEPTVTPTLVPTPEPTVSPTLNPTPEPTVTPSPTPNPTITPERFIPNTLKTMQEYDYISNSVTGISKKKASLKTLQKNVGKYGKLSGTGMPWEEYKEAMSYEWTDATDYHSKPVKIKVDLTKTMDYQSYVNILQKLSRYEGVYLYRIGESTEGRTLYAIEIDMASNRKKNVFMLTGQVHAREFAGGSFIMKQLVDLVQKAQTDEKTMELLKSNKFVAVPIINVDGREALIKNSSKWTRKGELWKAYINGTDGNRNFPGVQWGQLLKGYKRNSMIEDKAGYANYAGDYAGSNKETKAMMKWIYHYTIVEQADIYLDMHQQGSVIYAGKGWLTKKQDRLSQNLRSELLSFINQGNKDRKYHKIYESNDPTGLRGEGSSLTDYAMSLAAGAKFSPAYGFLAFTDGKKEYILLEVKDLDQSKIKFTPGNSKLATSTIEIGYGKSYLGNSAKTRELLNKEYTNYHFDKLLKALPGIIKK